MSTAGERWARLSAPTMVALCAACQLPPPNPATAGEATEAQPGAGAATSAMPPALLGRWQAGDEILEFRPDGTLLVNGAPTDYAILDSNLVVATPTGSLASPFELSGENLVLTLPAGPVTYRRVGPIGETAAAAAASPPAPAEADDVPGAAPTAAAPPATPPTTAGTAGGVDPTLVGKWCYVANVYANDGGRQSETCFVLNPDGTYRYHSESSSSNPYGGAWSQADDTGTWQATPSSLIAHSSTGRVFTYRLVRQNHPKNNDPMLVVDGQAFVTFYQKPPW